MIRWRQKELARWLALILSEGDRATRMLEHQAEEIQALPAPGR